MAIDIIYLVLIIISVIKGTQRGFIIAIFSIVAVVMGLAAAIKLSTVAAGYISGSVNISARWLPFVSFIVVFLSVVLIVRLGANILQKAVEIALLGWLNRLAGAVIYAAIYTIVYSILLFYADQLRLLTADTITASKVYPHVKPIGPFVINSIGTVIPFFKNMFFVLQEFFENASKGIPTK
jgi:membrane protein required for colicin V production